MTKFLFVRHGEPEYASVGDWNNVPMGIHFSGLSESGRKQIKNTCCELAKYKVDINEPIAYGQVLELIL